MAWRVAKSIPTLHEQLQRGAPRAAPPATPGDSWGTIGDVLHDTTSDHVPHDFPGWGDNIVTAGDFPNRPDLGLDAHQVLDDIRGAKDARAKYGISNDQIFSNHATTQDGVFYAAWTWRPYLPHDPNRDRHRDHGHLSVVGDARADGTQPWPTIGGDDLSPEESKALFEVRDRLRWVDARQDADANSKTTYKDPGGAVQQHLGVQERKAILADVQVGAVPAPVEVSDAQLETLADKVAARLSALVFKAQ